MDFKGFTLDDFQEEAIHAIEKHKSVIVSAATGTGKTLIADYLIDKYIKSNRKIIYTAPIKALSNQKYKDFKKSYGYENVGILTGDVAINHDAPVLIMTTEIYRNMLLDHDSIIDEIEYVIFDEIHYMSDPERGTVWEEAILFSPKNIHFLCLSATIPNAEEISHWIKSIKNQELDTIDCTHRAVPLKHYVYDKKLGLTTAKKLIFVVSKHEKRKYKRKLIYQIASPLEVINNINDKLPAIIFSFSRKSCEYEAFNLSKIKNFVYSEEQRKKIEKIFENHINSDIEQMESTIKIKKILVKGIAYHHAGLLPQQKAVVEELFAQKLIQVIFATETFSVGINMPAKTVVFNELRKYDGINFRFIKTREYFQLAGRAGRRGIDNIGYVVTIVDRKEDTIRELVRISTGNYEPIKSRFNLSFSTVLSLVNRHSDDEIDEILKNNFEYFTRRKRSKRQLRAKASYNNKHRLLKKLGYINFDGELTEKGEFARYIHSSELIIGEIFSTDFFKNLTDKEILQLIAGIIYEPRQNDHFSFQGVIPDYKKLLKKLQNNYFVIKNINKLSLKRMMAIVGFWSNNCRFEDLLGLTNLDEGDIIRLFRRIIDMINQIKHATSDIELRERLDICQQKIDRNLVAVYL